MTVVTVHSPQSIPMPLAGLRLALLIRAAISGGFAWYIAARQPQAASDLLVIFARYAAADAVVSLAQVAAMLALRARSEHVAVASLALLLRLGAALVIWFGPGIPYFAVTFVLYTGLLATLVLLLGIVELVEVYRARKAPKALRTILTIEGVATVGIALVALVLTPVPATVRELLIAGALIEGCSLLLVALFGLPSTGHRAVRQATS